MYGILVWLSELSSDELLTVQANLVFVQDTTHAHVWGVRYPYASNMDTIMFQSAINLIPEGLIEFLFATLILGHMLSTHVVINV